VDSTAHIEALQAEGARMATAVSTADPDAAVPTCPEWTVRDLTRHVGGVHRWATGYVADRRTEPWRVDLAEVVGSWPSDDDLANWLRNGCDDLAAALADAPDDLACWTFLPAPSPRAMWARRQAHETAIHRVDAQLAVDGPRAASMTRGVDAANAGVTTFDPRFAADGVDELLQLFVPRRSTTLRVDPPTTMMIRCTDVDAGWLLHLGPDGVQTKATGASTSTPTPDPADASKTTDGACRVSGTAGDLYLALWNRADAHGLTVEGDRHALTQFSEGVRITWT
jgi:uncharacterized protein (TIGR03083 family)